MVLMNVLTGLLLCVLLHGSSARTEDEYGARIVAVASHCGKTVTVHNTSIVLSLNPLSNRPLSGCTVTIKPVDGWYTRLNFTEVHFYGNDIPTEIETYIHPDKEAVINDYMIVKYRNGNDMRSWLDGGSKIFGDWSKDAWNSWIPTTIETPASGSLKDYETTDGFQVEVNSIDRTSKFSCIITAYKTGNCSELGLFKCNNGKCINPLLTHDYDDNCGDQSDIGVWHPHIDIPDRGDINDNHRATAGNSRPSKPMGGGGDSVMNSDSNRNDVNPWDADISGNGVHVHNSGSAGPNFASSAIITVSVVIPTVVIILLAVGLRIYCRMRIRQGQQYSYQIYNGNPHA